MVSDRRGSAGRDGSRCHDRIGRPKGERPSYKQWEEADIAPQVVFEILSPSNDDRELAKKFNFYERYGVEEYYTYNPETDKLKIWIRKGKRMRPVIKTDGFISPRTGVRFEFRSDQHMRVVGPDGLRFLNHLETREQYYNDLKTKEELLGKESQARRRAEADLQAYIKMLEEAGIDPKRK